MALFNRQEKKESAPLNTNNNTNNDDDDDDWIEVHDATWKPTRTGDCIIGKVIQKKQSAGPYGNAVYTLIDPKNNKKTSIWGKKQLDVLMMEVEEGDTIKVTYNGEVKTKDGNPMQTFSLMKKIKK